jgi:GT2 family glycosyltransferase
MLIKSDFLNQEPKLDEGYFFGIEDFDYCFQAKKKGWKTVFLPQAEVVHYHGHSSGGRRSTWSLEQERKGMMRFFAKNIPKKKFTKLMVDWMYKTKIFLLQLIIKKNESFVSQ